MPATTSTRRLWIYPRQRANVATTNPRTDHRVEKYGSHGLRCGGSRPLRSFPVGAIGRCGLGSVAHDSGADRYSRDQRRVTADSSGVPAKQVGPAALPSRTRRLLRPLRHCEPQYDGGPVERVSAGSSFHDVADTTHITFQNVSDTDVLKFICTAKIGKDQKYYLLRD
jgi:hypothetical protein